MVPVTQSTADKEIDANQAEVRDRVSLSKMTPLYHLMTFAFLPPNTLPHQARNFN